MSAAQPQRTAADQSRPACPSPRLQISGNRARRARQGDPAQAANDGKGLADNGPGWPHTEPQPEARRASVVREWRGRTHTVTITEDGFEYAGTSYPSLTKIAKRITGAHWSGPRFFGLLAAGAERPSNGGRDGGWGGGGGVGGGANFCFGGFRARARTPGPMPRPARIVEYDARESDKI